MHHAKGNKHFETRDEEENIYMTKADIIKTFGS
jgi:hypothetical protein